MDEKKLWFEGKLLCDILRMSRQIEVEYLYIRTRKELFASLNPAIDIPRTCPRYNQATHCRLPREPRQTGEGKGAFWSRLPSFFSHTGTFLGAAGNHGYLCLSG